jgi:predicted ATPase/class 3 adenylate cyclase/Flp pilus assembly protein TadD
MTTPAPVALLLTDVVDSAAIAERLGDETMAAVWGAHDRVARDLLRTWRGREIDKTDGFLLLFAEAADALGYVMAYHQALARLPLPAVDGDGRPLRLRARAGLHVGQVSMRENPAADVALGAKPIEVDGVSKPIAARVMSTALGGQTLLTRPVMDALQAGGPLARRAVSHGYWHVKGLPAPLELFEVGEDDAPFVPPPDSDKVYRVVRQGDLWLPLRELRHSLPAERDAFVGRRAVLQELAARFDGVARLVSLLGIGGGGKTRLATRFGWGWMGEFPGGVWFCDLAPARTIEGLASAVAQGLQVPLGQEDPVVQLGHAIAGRGACLVILDNFEQLARHAEATVGRWLGQAAQACFLVTTREVLGIAGEQTLALAPLQADDARTLFLRRAAAAKRDFQPAPEDEAAIAPLVKLLDGLPLAIELAAARVRTLAPRALLARMSERFKLLASSGGRQDRQATLRAAFDWSWDLLPTAEKMALAQLSVFEGGFTLEAAEAVIDVSALADPPWTLDVVNALVDKSFVRTLADERLDLLVSVQAYADEHLRTEGRYNGSGPAALAAAHARHGAWFAALGPQRATENRCADLDNLVAACRRAVAVGDSTAAAGALDGAWAALSLHGPFKAGADLAEAVCAMPGLGGRAAAHAHAVLGAALEDSGQRARAAAHFEQALQHAQRVGDAACEAAVTVRLGGLHARAGQADTARQEHSRAVALARGLDDGALECAALNGLGTVEFEQGRMEQAQVHYEGALALARRIGDARWQASLLGNLGNLNANLGRMDEARVRGEESLEGLRKLGDRQREGNALSNLGMLSYLQGNLAAATALLEQGLAVARELGHVRLECIVLANLALVDDASGHLAEAVTRYAAALAVARRIGDRRMEGQCLGHLGLAQARQRDFVEATVHLEAGLAILEQVADPLSLGLLHCQRAECAWLIGDTASAERAHAAAGLLAINSGAGPRSELGSALARVSTLIAAAAP